MKEIKIRHSLLVFSFLLSVFFFSINSARAMELNIIPNPSVETAASDGSPEGWVAEQSGNHVANFEYLDTGHSGNKSLKVEITSYTGGDSHYKFNQQPVVAGEEYEFSFYYKSDVLTEVDAEITLSNGELAYVYMGDVPASDVWSEYTATVTMPANASTATVYATIFSVGYLITDDYHMGLTPDLVPVEGNIVPNPSVETAAADGSPEGWVSEQSGNHVASFGYLNTGYSGDKSLKVEITSYTGGDSHYKFNQQPVVAGEEYEFSFYYKSDVYTEVDAEIILGNGEYSYIYVGSVVPSTTWNEYTATVTMPANASTATVYATIFSVGYLITDDYHMEVVPDPVPLSRAIVTLTYDESASTVYEYGFPIFEKYDMVGDFYVLSEEMGMDGMMSKEEFNAWRGIGFDIGSHTITHPYMTQISEEQMIGELKDSQSVISEYFDGMEVSTFSSPYGDYNVAMIEETKKYYQSHRTTDEGFNSKDNFDPYKIKAFSIESNMSAQYVTDLVDQAIADNTWLVLVYHDIEPDDGSGFLWTTTPENMETVLAYLKDNDVAVMTTSQAISEIQSQM